MEYKEKIWLTKRTYIALFGKCFVVVEVDENGKEVKWAIFGGDK